MPFRLNIIKKLSVTLSGSGDLWNEGTIKSSNFSTAVAGSGDLILSIDVDKAEASVSGSGDLTLKGKATSFKTGVAGSGDINGFKLDSKNVDVSVTGSGSIEFVVIHHQKILKSPVQEVLRTRTNI